MLKFSRIHQLSLVILVLDNTDGTTKCYEQIKILRMHTGERGPLGVYITN